MSIPKEPRQIMINLMYLVLTALLALNVSSEILAAFRTINKSINRSNASIDDKNAAKYKFFQDQMDTPSEREKTKPYYDLAMQIKAQSSDLVNYLDNWKKRLIMQSGGYRDSVTGEILNESDLHAATDLLVEKEKGGDEIKKRLENYRSQLLKALDMNENSPLAKSLPLKIENVKPSDANPKGEWSAGNFYNMPVIAAVTLMSKFQNDIKNSEAMVVDQLFDKIHEKDVKFDDFKAVAVPKQSYLLEGQKVEAEILLAAYKTTLNPTVSASGGGGRVVKIEQGVAHWEGTATGKGLQTVSGKISLDMGGKVATRDYKFEYMVGSTGASMQLDKMNVFYIGVPNPVTVSAAGYSMEDISLNIPGAQITSGGALGKYNVSVTQQGKVMAVISAKTPTGPKEVGKQEIRVKVIPDPVAEINGKSGSFSETAARMKISPGIVAAMKGFDFEAKFLVTGFDLFYLQKRQDPVGPLHVSGPLFSAMKQVQQIIDKCKPGDKFFIESIKAKGPDNTPRSLNPIIITVN